MTPSIPARYTGRVVGHHDGADLGPVDIHGPQSEAEAVEAARTGAIALTRERGLTRAYVVIRRNGFTIRRVDIHAQRVDPRQDLNASAAAGHPQKG